MRKTLVCSTSLVVFLCATACGGGDSAPSRPSPAPASPAAAPASSGPTEGTSGVNGSIAFQGEAPKPQAISMSADPQCQARHTGPVYTDTVTVNSNGTLKDVFVYVKAGLEGKTYPAPTEEAIFDQNGCKYDPHVLGVQAKQTIKVLNSDGLLHNVHALPSLNAQFNQAMPKFQKEWKTSFEKPEVMIRVKCEVHPWMGAWIGVLDHPFFSVSDDTGAFSIEGLPAGDYTIEAWHEKYAAATQQISLADGEVKEISFTFQAN